MCIITFGIFLSAVDCGTLSSPSNGQVILTGIAFGSTATYACNSGFNLVGNMQRTCQNNGDWSGTQPNCDGNTQNVLISFKLLYIKSSY